MNTDEHRWERRAARPDPGRAPRQEGGRPEPRGDTGAGAWRLRGVIERVTFQNADTGFTVARLRPEGRPAGDLVTVVGQALSLTAGESVVMDGAWGQHAEYGRQFKVERCEKAPPSTVEGMRRYLGSGMIKGIGPVMAGRIVDRFGTEALDVIENEPGRLKEVEGLGPKRARMITQAWKAQKEVHGVMLFLQSHEVSTGYAVKIWKTYGQEAVAKIQENPYRLATDIWGIGFLTADRIAQKLGVDPASEQRILAGVRHVLSRTTEDEGHVFILRQDLVQACVEALDVDAASVAACLDRLKTDEEVVEEDGRVYPPALYYAEKGVASRLREHAQIARIEAGDLEREIDAIEHETAVSYAPLQRKALRAALTAGALVLTGGPGTGKTTTVKGLIALLETRKRRIALAAPTGRAAKRMQEATGRDASTIHRLLKFSPGGGFQMNGERRLQIDALIVDEMSMVDVVLLNALLRAVPIHATVVLVGDVDQLPSVGPGSVLRDIIAAGRVETVALNEIFRQAQTSRIVTNAHRINRGEMPEVRNSRDSDFFFVEVEDPAEVAETVSGLCATRLPATYGFDPIDDIQVLSPMYRGETGATHLNERLQDALNPKGAELARGDARFREGDKVMQVRNNYDKDVYNGDIGRIRSIDAEEQSVTVDYGERQATYDFAELDEVTLAYAVSVHKSQGSEFRAVVLPLTTQHYVMLQRNLLYTAITRARRLAVIVGTKKALAIAVRNNLVAQRNTTLADRLRGTACAEVHPR